MTWDGGCSGIGGISKVLRVWGKVDEISELTNKFSHIRMTYSIIRTIIYKGRDDNVRRPIHPLLWLRYQKECQTVPQPRAAP